MVVAHIPGNGSGPGEDRHYLVSHKLLRVRDDLHGPVRSGSNIILTEDDPGNQGFFCFTKKEMVFL